MTVKTNRRPAGKRLGVRWGLGPKSASSSSGVSWPCSKGEHNRCSSLRCTCPHHFTP